MDDSLLTKDEFLGGRLTIRQPKHGYRAATDPVFLAAATSAKPQESVLEIGCGVGVSILCLISRVPGLKAQGIEIQQDYAQLARQNAEENSLQLEVTQGDLREMPAKLKGIVFDHVIMNPPYFRNQDITPPANIGKDTAHRERDATLRDFVEAGLKRLKQKGWLTMINKADRLADILSALQGKAADIQILPLQAHADQNADRIILRARKSSSGPLILHAPLVIHRKNAQDQMKSAFSPIADNILRHGHALNFK